jgi:hypothetical protein
VQLNLFAEPPLAPAANDTLQVGDRLVRVSLCDTARGSTSDWSGWPGDGAPTQFIRRPGVCPGARQGGNRTVGPLGGSAAGPALSAGDDSASG